MSDVFLSMIQPESLIMMNLGIMVGIVVGAMPGLNTVFAITILLPFTFGMDSVSGMYLLLGASCGGLFGGSISAILLNTPGTPAACATVIDGYPLAEKGRAGDALKSALISSCVGGLLSCLALLFFAPVIAKFALNFASPEFFSLCVFGMATVIGVSEGKVIKGLLAALLGILISTVGIDANDGTQRFMFGNLNLLSGISSVVVMLGVFAMAEVLCKVEKYFIKKDNNKNQEESQRIVKSSIKVIEILKYWKTLIKSSVMGIIIGAIPGTGGAMAAMLSYNEAKRSSKNPEEFGKGCIEGVIAPECGNNAVSGAALIPMLTLGIPGDAGAAVLLGALTMQGITPGTALFSENKTWVYAIMGGLFLINLFMLLQGLFLVKPFTWLTKIPQGILLPCIIMLCVVGSFSISNSIFNVLLMVVFGIVGYILKKFDFPLPPLIIAMVLGPTLERNLRRSLTISKGSYLIFIREPLSCIILIIALLMLLMPVMKKILEKRNNERGR